MIQLDDLFEMGLNFQNQGNIPMATQMYNEILKVDPKYSMVHVNMAKVLGSQGNIQGELEALKQFMKCPLTGNTFEMVQPIKNRINEIEQKLKQVSPPASPK